MASISKEVRGLKEKFLDTIRKHDMLEIDNKVVVSVSGGPDSIALLHLLHSIRPIYNIKLHVFHLDHQIRGENSRQDAVFVQEQAEALGLPISSLCYDIPAYVANKNLSLQEGAREIRYQLLDEVCKQVKADKIAVGHTADDQVETFLMRIIRGTGGSGLRGIPPVRGRIIRPLIEASREEIEYYLAEKKIEYRLDESNLKADYLRNRVRHRLIPLLSQENEGFSENVLNTIALVSDDEAYLERVAEDAFKNIAYYEDGEVVSIDCSRLSRLAVAVQRRVIRQAIESIKGSLREIEFKHIELILSELKKDCRMQIDLPGGVLAACEYGNLVIMNQEQVQVKRASESRAIELKIPGITSVPFLGIDIAAKFEDAKKVSFNQDREGQRGYVDYEKLKPPLWVRTRLAGDRFIPLGMSGEKKLQDFFVDKKIPARKRDKIPIIESQEQIVWIGKMAIDDRVKVTYFTDKVLVLEVK